MRLFITDNGSIAFRLSEDDQAIIRKAADGTTLSPRALCEVLAEHYTNTLAADASDLAEYYRDHN